jgi:hypothetical protein
LIASANEEQAIDVVNDFIEEEMSKMSTVQPTSKKAVRLESTFGNPM